ncbi:MAG: DUF3467 domain-containing protein [Candidatus Korobacteraceae bacterium]
MPPEENANNVTAVPTPEMEVIRAADYKTIYTNHVQGGVTPFDISLEIGEAGGYNKHTNKWTVDLKAKVTMSPTEAKVVLAILAGTIKSFEEQFGPISIPHAVQTGPIPIPDEVAKRGGDKGEGV